MKKLAILKDKGKGNYGGAKPLSKENILLLTETRLSKYDNDVPFLTTNDVIPTTEELTVAGANEVGDLQYYAYATKFPAGNKFYGATPKTVTLEAGDGTYGRVDLIIANRPDVVGGMGYITVDKGTPSLGAQPNNIDLATQYIIKWIFVDANATVGVDVTPPPLSAIPTLQQVTNAGSITTNDISIIGKNQFEVINGDISSILDSNGVHLSDNVNNTITDFVNRGIVYGEGANSIEILFPFPTFNRVINFPDASGTVALLSDITGVLGNLQKVVTATTYTILDSDNNYTIFFNSATAVTVTINTLTVDNFACDFYNLGAGTVTFIDGTATVGYPDGTDLATDKVCALIRFMATTTYKLKGELV